MAIDAAKVAFWELVRAWIQAEIKAEFRRQQGSSTGDYADELFEKLQEIEL